MAKRAKKAVSKRRVSRGTRPNVLESLKGDEALAILKTLVAHDRRLAKTIEALVEARSSPVEMETVAANVVTELESLEIEDVWDRSGGNRYGYVEPTEAAWEMFEEALQPFRDEADECRRLSKKKEADLVYQGILKGLHDFEEESASEFKECAADAPAEYFGMVLDEWKKLFGKRLPVDRMGKFLETQREVV